MLAAPSPRIAAGKQRQRLRWGRATGATANPRRREHGKERLPGANPTQDLFAEDLLPQGLKHQAGFAGPEEEVSLLRQMSAFRSGSSSSTASPASAGRFHSGGVMISMEAASRRPRTCRNFLLSSGTGRSLGRHRTRQQVLVTEYGPGAGIGWHRDRSVFGDVLGISLLSSCTFRLRRKGGNSWERRRLTVKPRSAYLLAALCAPSGSTAFPQS